MKLKYIYLSGIIIVLITTSIMFLSKDSPVSAEGAKISFLRCSEPIPTGDSYESVFALNAEVYNEYVNLRNYIRSAVEQVQSEVTELYRKDGKVCDFSLCMPYVIDQGPILELEVSYLVGKKKITGVHLPLCTPLECIGEPCPDLTKYLEHITGLKNAVKASHEIIDEMFNLPSVPVTEDLRRRESVGTLIKRTEEIYRKLQLSREWLHAAAEKGWKSCSLSKSDRKKVASGEIGDRYPMRCVDALAQGIYWPKMWSEECSKSCRPESDIIECKACLSYDSSDTSVLARINYKIYNTCSNVCNEELNENCRNCLCTIKTNEEKIKYAKEKGETMTDDECIAWICGGSYYNDVCCYEDLIEVK